MTMAPMGIRLSPLGMAVFCLLGVGVIYHLYAGVFSNHLSYFRQRKKVDLRDLLAVSVEAAQLGGEEVKRVRKENTLNEKSKGETKEGAKELLTMGDLQSHRKMYNLIKNTFPEITVYSEESDSKPDSVSWSRNIPDGILKLEKGREVSADSITVWIDPLDATQEYTVESSDDPIYSFFSPSSVEQDACVELVLEHRCQTPGLEGRCPAGFRCATEKLVKYVTTMVCVALEGKPVIGVIHQPFTGFTAWAMVGQGTNMEHRSSYNLNSPKVIVSRSHSGEVKNFLHSAFGNSTTIIPAGGAGYKVLSLLKMHSGQTEPIDEADVYIHITVIKKWDICAGAALLNALGGHMTTLKGENIDFSGTPLNEGGLVASVEVDHKNILAKLPNWDLSKH